MQSITLTPTEARRLAIAAQRLTAPRPQASKEGILELLRQINCLQIDPIRAVERTQLLVLWSRVGAFDPGLLDQLQEERHIIEGEAHRASFVLTEDYPLLRRWIGRSFDSKAAWVQLAREWMEANAALQQQISARLQADGPLPATAFDDLEAARWTASSWFSGKPASRMLDFLNGLGVVISVGRRGNQRLWHLRDAWLPAWADEELPDEELPDEEEVVRLACQRSLKALGVANQKQINSHFMRNMYPNLGERLTELMAEKVVLPAQIVGEQGPWAGQWYLHRDALPLLESIRAAGWEPRTVFLSPFDNLICDRERTQQFFDFHYRIEIYVPKAKRQYGYYVLPLLHGDRFIGRMDSQIDRKAGIYHIHALHPEQDAPSDAQSRAAAAESLLELAQFNGAARIELGERIPAIWRSAMQEVTHRL